MFSHYGTRKISPICKFSTFCKDLSFHNPRGHLNAKYLVKRVEGIPFLLNLLTYSEITRSEKTKEDDL